MSDVLAKRQLDELYAELPTIDCKRECHSSCGPIAMTRVEWGRIQKKLGFTPRATSTTCPMLRNNLCSVYPVRPMLCRLWGLIETMRCPWGCQPERVLSTREGYVFLMRAELISASEQDRPAVQEQLDHLLSIPDDDPIIQMSRSMHVQPQIELPFGAKRGLT